jgi:hypothetical protein
MPEMPTGPEDLDKRATENGRVWMRPDGIAPGVVRILIWVDDLPADAPATKPEDVEFSFHACFKAERAKAFGTDLLAAAIQAAVMNEDAPLYEIPRRKPDA